MKKQLLDIAHARSGDKGDAVNVGLIARDPAYYDFLREAITTERVREHFGAHGHCPAMFSREYVRGH